MPNLDDLHVRIFNSWRMHIFQNWNELNVCSSFWRLYVNDQTGAKALLDDGAFDLTAGRVHIIPAWVKFSCYCRGHVDHNYISFDVLGLPPVIVRQVFNQPVTLPRSTRLRALVRTWVDALRARTPQDLTFFSEVKALVYCALAALFRHLTPDQRTRCGQYLPRNDRVAPALDYIDRHLDEQLSNPKLAKLCHLGDDHFIELFRQSVGKTPAQYVLERRISAAAQQLVLSADKVEDVAAQAGFCDRYYFTRVFTRRMGMPPAAYRKANH